MDIQKKPKLAEKQAFWVEQLPNFESKYWLPSHFEFLAFDMDHGNYVIKDDLDPIYEDDANEIFHRVNTGWAMWKKAVNFTVNEAKASVPEGFVLVKNNSKTVVAIIKALNNYGYVILQNPISEKMEAAGKQATGMGMFGYSMQDAIDAMIEAQEVS